MLLASNLVYKIQTMKPRIVILSDLWGFENADWLNIYLAALESTFDIKHYDSCELGNVSKIPYEESHLHHQFVNGGIAKAIKNLLQLEPGKIHVLAFSVGGAIAWKAQLQGLDVTHLYAISSTRLRYEKERIVGDVSLYFGEEDEYKPDNEWFATMSIKPKLVKEKGHRLYTEQEFIVPICNEIKRNQ